MAAPPRPTRRQEYAQETRQAIVDAARKLFAERGYFATRVDDIAAEARVSPATVYSVTGGKQSLLTGLIVSWNDDPMIASTLDGIDASVDSVEIIRQLASASRTMRESFVDIMQVMLVTAPHDTEIAELERRSTTHYRSAIESIAERLVELGEVQPGLQLQDVADLLWFYFGYASYFTLVGDNGWSYERAEGWLAEQAVSVLLTETPGS